MAGPSLVEKFQCNRCHTVENVPPPTMDKQCVGCHISIEEGRYDAPQRVLRTWQKHIVHLVDVPSLVSTDVRFQREWLSAFLQKPHRLRPLLQESMPRLNISEDEARSLAEHLVPMETTRLDLADADMDRGRTLLDTRGCGSCHTLTGAPSLKHSLPSVRLEGGLQGRGLRLAPDLRHTRERFQRGRLVAWLQNPKALKADTLMPNEGLSVGEAKDIAAYLLNAPLVPTKRVAIPQRLNILTRRVRFPELQKKVFHKTCWHCHSEPDYARGDGGPGNTGGFGFAGRGINLADYGGVASGHINRQGERVSLFTPTQHEGMPLLVAALWARHHEVAGSAIPGIRGMPLGLPPLPAEEIQLIESWIAQGRPQ
jgi:cytochrome c2